jgi:hypothetical protein
MPHPTNPAHFAILAETRAWVDRAVIGLNLCPFAKAVQVKNQIRYVVSEASNTDALLDALCTELHLLANTPREITDTTLLIHPQVLGDFLDFNDFLEIAYAAIEALHYEGILQIASFHPHFQFAETKVDDVTNATNQSPFPILHILREESIDRAVSAFPDAEAIYAVNMQTLEKLGAAGWRDLQAACKKDAGVA